VSHAAASAVKSERERLARDLHDGLGSGVHRLQRLTELLERADPGSEAQRLREDMLRTAQELSGSLDRAVWAVKPENDTLENLMSFLAAYAPSVLDPHGIECELDLPSALPARVLSGDTRQNWFFAVNEALQNVVKHAGARRACLRAIWADPWLTVIIEDEGCGRNDALDRAGGGHGLEHLRFRMSALGGSAQWSPRPRGGWRVELRAPMAAST
jgi:signal transduction histidine kinase